MGLQTDNDGFTRDFLTAYLAPGFGNMPKREIDLLVLDLLVKHDKSLSWEDPPSAFRLAQLLGVKRGKIRALMDDLSFRRPPISRDDLAKKVLRTILSEQEIDTQTSTVKIQIEDGYCREYAKNLVRVAGGIADGSFDRSIITLSADRYLILASEVATEQEQARLIKALKEKTELPIPNHGNAEARRRELRHEFLKGVAGVAGQEITREAFRLGRLLLTGGASELPGVVRKVYQLTRHSNEGE